MTYIDTRSYDQYEMWQRQKKAPQWLAGYKEGFSGSPLPSTVYSLMVTTTPPPSC